MADTEKNPVGRPLTYKTVEELQAAIDLYFETDAYMVVGVNRETGDDIKTYAPTMSGLALSLGVDRKTLVTYSHKDEFLHALKKARAKVEVALEQHLYTKNVAGVIFNLKNNFAWTDSQQVQVTPSAGAKYEVNIIPAVKEDA